MLEITLDTTDSDKAVTEKIQPISKHISDLILNNKISFPSKEYIYIKQLDNNNEYKTYQISIKEII